MSGLIILGRRLVSYSKQRGGCGPPAPDLSTNKHAQTSRAAINTWIIQLDNPVLLIMFSTKPHQSDVDRSCRGSACWGLVNFISAAAQLADGSAAKQQVSALSAGRVRAHDTVSRAKEDSFCAFQRPIRWAVRGTGLMLKMIQHLRSV